MRQSDLERYASVQREIGEIEELIVRKRSAAERATHVLSSMPKGAHSRSKQEAYIEFLYGRIQDIYAEKLTLNQQCADIETMIDRLEDSMQRRVLRHKYIDGLDWEKVGEKIGYSDRQCKRIRDTAFKILSIEKDVPPCPEDL